MNYSCENCVYNTCCEANKRHCVKEGFDKVLSTLSPREEVVIKYLYGYDGVCHSIADAQRNIQLECESIPRIKARVFRLLRHPNRRDIIKSFLFEIFECPTLNFYSLLTLELLGLKKNSLEFELAKKGINLITVNTEYRDDDEIERITTEMKSPISSFPLLADLALLLEENGIVTLKDLLSVEPLKLYTQIYSYKEYLIERTYSALKEMGYAIRGNEEYIFMDEMAVDLIADRVNLICGVVPYIRGNCTTCREYLEERLIEQDFYRYCRFIKSIVYEGLKAQFIEREESCYLMIKGLHDDVFYSKTGIINAVRSLGYVIEDSIIAQAEKTLKEAPIEFLNLSVRAFNCLKRANYNYISEVRHLSVEQLSSIRNMGDNSILEVLEKISEFDGKGSNRFIIEKYYSSCGIPFRVSDLSLSESIIGRLIKAGYFLTKDLIKVPKEDLLEIEGMEERDIILIEEELSKYGFKLDYQELLQIKGKIYRGLWR